MIDQRPDPEVIILDAALKLPSGQSAAYLDEACAGDAALRQRVEDLVRANARAGAFLDNPAPGIQKALETEAQNVAGAENPLSAVLSEKAGDSIGRYKLRKQIGEGGCGVVYEAEQEEPVRRMVAIKVIKLGMDTKNVIVRFEAERQALARMDHPNIAKVWDAGATETGRPYFVMELVRGVKITDYCDGKNLNTLARLELFVQVCQAIQHAHQKGIIHRDIKPSNVLVTDQDGVPVSKVIDFGIAKATEGRLTDRTLFTAFEQFLGTPAYMSPEQAAMTSGDIDTRSDIYSLGVLLYELLTGRTPFDTQKLLSSGIDEIRRTIRDQDPVRPSTRLSTMTGADLTAIAKCRKVEPPRLIHLVKGDLDWIVMKALEKDRALRYETANGLAADVQRHLKNEPVVARPPGNFYRLQKLVRRNKLAFAAAALMAVVLVTATGVSVRQADLARQRLVESEAITKFLTQVFQSPDPSRDGRTITVAETLGTAVKKLETDLANQPSRRARLQAALATTYHGLGLDQEAIPLQEKVRDYYLSIAGLEDPNTLKAMHSLALSYVATGRRAEALQLQEQVLKLRLKVLGPENPDTLWAMNNLSFSYDEANRREEAFKLREQALALRRKVNGPEHPDTLWAMNTLAFSYDDLGRWNEALKLREETCALCLKVLGPEHPSTLLALQCLAYSYYELDRRDEALKLQEDLVNTLRRVSGPEHPATLWVMHDLAVSYSDAGRLQEALAMQEQVLALRRKLLGPENFNTIWTMHTMASTLDALGRRDEALKLREQVLALRLKTGGPEQPSTLSAMGNLAISYEEAGRGEEAIKLREQTLAGRRKVLAPGHPDTLEAMGEMAKSYASAGREKEALSLLEQVCAASPKDAGAALALAAWQNWFGHEADYEATRGRAVQQAEGTDRASTAGYAAKAACLKPSADAALLEKALNLAHRSAEFGKSSSFLPTLQLDLGLAEYRKGQFTNAERTLTTAEQSMRGSPELLGTARLLRAMSMFREGRPEEARKLFSQAEAQIPPLPRDESKPRVDGGQVDQNFVICWMAYKEAKALIEPPSTAALK